MSTWIWLYFWFVVLIGFGLIEGYFLIHPDRGWTLSRTMAYVGSRYPITAVLFGATVSGLAIHFYAPYCPEFH